MVILAIGDICADSGIAIVKDKLPLLRKLYDVDLAIANGENSAAGGVGITVSSIQSIMSSGVDIVTTGNHSFTNQGYENLYENTYGLLRPYNLGKGVPGKGYMLYDKGRYQVLVVNMLGIQYMNTASTNFYDAMDEILEKENADVVVVDFHAEYTSEKIAFARNYDGMISLVFGTHTHVQTADETIFPNGTAFISDLGMTGVKESVIGVDIKKAIDRQRYAVPIRLAPAKGPSMISGILVEIDEKTKQAKAIERLCVEE